MQTRGTTHKLYYMFIERKQKLSKQQSNNNVFLNKNEVQLLLLFDIFFQSFYSQTHNWIKTIFDCYFGLNANVIRSKDNNVHMEMA